MSNPPVALPSHPPRQVADRLIESRGPADLLAALDLLLDDRQALIVWFRSLVAVPERLARVVASSYWHANGFAKLVLHEAPDFRIRLHVWPAGANRRGEPDPHSHRWDFASTVLVGDGLEIVESTELLEPDSDTDVECHRYAYDGFGLVPDMTVFLHQDRRFDVPAGGRYTTETTAIHTVAPKGNDLVATLLVQGPHVNPATAVYGTDLDDPVDRPGRVIDAEDIRALVSDVVATLEPRGCPMTAPTADPPAPMPPGTRLVELGERRIVAEILEPRYRSVPSFGDDCAPLGSDRVITTDSCGTALVAGLGETDPVHTGWLLATINLSDLAAAGAQPEGLVVNYTFPPDTPVRTLSRIMDGVDACAAFHGTRVLGGDIGEGCEMRLSATAVGLCPHTGPDAAVSRLSRRGARAGDRLLLVGSPGYLWGAALLFHGFADVTDDERREVFGRACRPKAQLAAGGLLATHRLARSATDVSDGLYASIRSLCRANGVGALIDTDVRLDGVLQRVCERAEVHPFQLAQTWGDWCLLVAVRPGDVEVTRNLLAHADTDAQDIGVLTPATGEVRLNDGSPEPPRWDGIDQERFSSTSWRGEGIPGALNRMRELSRRPSAATPTDGS